jgi:hypothetical protein
VKQRANEAATTMRAWIREVLYLKAHASLIRVTLVTMMTNVMDSVGIEAVRQIFEAGKPITDHNDVERLILAIGPELRQFVLDDRRTMVVKVVITCERRGIRVMSALDQQIPLPV